MGREKKDRTNVIYYTQKDKLYIASPNLQNFDAEATSARWAIEMNQATSVRAGMQHLQEHHPEIYYTRGASVRCHLRDPAAAQARREGALPRPAVDDRRAAARAFMRTLIYSRSVRL